jgi:hypothetical protein
MTRKWFQIHLSTAIVLMFVGAAIVALNFGMAARSGGKVHFGFPFHCFIDQFPYVNSWGSLILNVVVWCAIGGFVTYITHFSFEARKP